MLEREGPVLDLGMDDMDGASLLPSTDGIPLGSVLELGLTLILGITLRGCEPEGANVGVPLGSTLTLSSILGMLERDPCLLHYYYYSMTLASRLYFSVSTSYLAKKLEIASKVCY